MSTARLRAELERFRRLRSRAWRSRECPLCGIDPEAPLGSLEYEVTWNDTYPADLEGDIAPAEAAEERCEGCGRRLTYTVRWLDIPLYPEPGYYGESPDD